MGSLSNLYISQSYQSLLHFSTDSSASATLTQLQDGIGQDLGLFLNTNGDLRTTTSVSSSTIEATNLKIKNKIELTGSIDIDGPVTASAAFIETDLIVSGTLYAKEVHTLIESSSIIFSTGSNILGDSTADIQTLNGKVIVSGSEEITGSLFVTNDISSSTLNGVGNVTLYSQSVDSRLDNLETYSGSAEQKFVAIQASTASLNAFTQSANSRLNNLESKSASVDISITNINNFTASQETKNNTLELYTASIDNKFVAIQASTSSLNNFTSSQLQKDSALETWTGSTFVSFSQSVDFRLDTLEAFTGSQGLLTTSSFQLYTASVNADLNAIKISTASLNAFTQSAEISLSALNTNTASVNNSVSLINSFTSSANNRLNSLESVTSSYATTGSNSFNGNQIITGSLILSSSAAVELTAIGNSIFSGSVRGVVNALTVSSNTASMDCSLGNFFTLTLISGSQPRLVATNIQPGETISLRVTQPSVSVGGLTYTSSNIKFPSGNSYTPTQLSNAIDVLTFISFDTSSLFSVSSNQMV